MEHFIVIHLFMARHSFLLLYFKILAYSIALLCHLVQMVINSELSTDTSKYKTRTKLKLRIKIELLLSDCLRKNFNNGI